MSKKCPLYLRKRTCAVQLRMSAMGQKRTLSFLDQSGGSQRLVDHRSDLSDVRHPLVLTEYIVVFVENLAVQDRLRLLIRPSRGGNLRQVSFCRSILLCLRTRDCNPEKLRDVIGRRDPYG